MVLSRCICCHFDSSIFATFKLYDILLYNMVSYFQLKGQDILSLPFFFGFNKQVVGANKGGVVAMVEGLRGFVPFSQVSTVNPLPSS